MNPEAELAYRFLTEKPAQYGQMLGYPDLRDDLHGFGGVWNHSEIEKKKREMEELDNPNLQKQSEDVEFETFVD